MRIKVFNIPMMLILTMSVSGCFNNKWTDAEKYILERQSNRMASWKAPTNQVEFSNCFKEYILDNYTGKEYMNSGTAAASLAIIECQK